MKSQVNVKNNAQVFLAESHLLDGRVVIVRAIRPSDKSLLIDEAEHMSKRSMYYRYFIPKKQLTTKELVYFTEVDYHRHVCLIALVQEPDGRLVHAGCGRYIVFEKNDQIAEVAFDVKDEYQGHGVGTILFNFLRQIAQAEGIREFTADVLVENTHMLEVFDHLGLAVKKKYLSSGVVEVRIELN
ncbi:GNAT family N-acetyltransferase [bacterium]|nr:GNAT family N-acetyltransferase [bacterium]